MVLAQTTGIMVERRFRRDLERLAKAAEPIVAASDGAEDQAAALRVALDMVYRDTLFTEGAFVLTADGHPVAGVPGKGTNIGGAIDLRKLAAACSKKKDIVASPLVYLSPSNRPILILLVPLHGKAGRILGFVAGSLGPASTNILDLSTRELGAIRTELHLIDANGVAVASTDRKRLFQISDHNSSLSRALAEKRNFKGRCHSCHGSAEKPQEKETDVLAFAPLPSLRLGITVHQPEREALAPAFALRTKLQVLGLFFVSLFLLFAGLAVRSVVVPITKLSKAVHHLSADDSRTPLPKLGSDELGALVNAFENWRKRMFEALQQVKQQRGQEQYLHQVLNAQEEERRRVARDIHDTIAQDLAALRLKTERLAQHAADGSDKDELLDLERRVKEMLDTTRGVLKDLRLPPLVQVGFVPTLIEYLQRIEGETGVRGIFTVDGDEVDLPYAVIAPLYRIVQEATQNALQHAAPDHIAVTVNYSATSIELSVEDDGHGFDVETFQEKRWDEESVGLGLMGIRERAKLLGGDLEISSSTNQGTQIRVTIPLPPRTMEEGRPQ
jgi:signal transduction histidine kinase